MQISFIRMLSGYKLYVDCNIKAFTAPIGKNEQRDPEGAEKVLK